MAVPTGTAEAAGCLKEEDGRGAGRNRAKAEWVGRAGPKRKLGQRRIKSRKMKIKWVGYKELWAETYFGLPRENENIFEIFWLHI
jgi:hypothetical protein